MKLNADKSEREIVQKYGDLARAKAGREVDPRVTRAGRVVRRTSLDELPQLVNVMKGEISIVGPRPISDDEAKSVSSDSLEKFADLLARGMKYGIAGPYALLGRAFAELSERISRDVEYGTRANFKADLRIFARTLGVILAGRGAR